MYVPESAVQLVNKEASYCQPAHVHNPPGDVMPEAVVPEELPLPHANRFSGADVVRPQLADAANGLSELLDRQWMTCVASPPPAVTGAEPASCR